MDRRMLQGLLAEWESAHWLLPRSIRLKVAKPLFSIHTMPGRLGTWDGAKREIRLSRDLVDGGRWDDVREVFLHEMAHQVAHEGLGAVSETAHGKGFFEACRHLRANPSASVTFRPLHQRLQQGETPSEQDRLVLRIRKLMALAESNNIHEAKAAMDKAHQLLLHHNIALIDDAADRNYHSIFLGRPRLRHFREVYHLAHLLQDHYFVQGVWIAAWVLEKAKMGRVLEISGTRTNVLIAEYVHDSVCRYIDAQWAVYRRGKKLNHHRKTDYAIGVIEGFRSTLKRAMDKVDKETRSGLPAMRQNDALTRFMAHRYPALRSFTRQGSRVDGHILSDGKKTGRKLVVSRGICHRQAHKDGQPARLAAPRR